MTEKMERPQFAKAYDQNSQGHHVSCAKILAKSAPMTNPQGAIAPKSEKTMFFLMPGGYALPSSASAFGTINAAPIPCIPRQTSKKM